MFIRSNYNYDVDEASNVSAIGEFPETLTQQHFKDETDINRIVKQFGVTGMVNATTAQSLPEGFYGITDYHASLNAIKRADEAFMGLPADVRENFANDAGRFVDFATNPANNEALARMFGRSPTAQNTDSATPSPSAQPTPEGGAQ